MRVRNAMKWRLERFSSFFHQLTVCDFWVDLQLSGRTNCGGLIEFPDFLRRVQCPKSTNVLIDYQPVPSYGHQKTPGWLHRFPGCLPPRYWAKTELPNSSKGVVSYVLRPHTGTWEKYLQDKETEQSQWKLNYQSTCLKSILKLWNVHVYGEAKWKLSFCFLLLGNVKIGKSVIPRLCF